MNIKFKITIIWNIVYKPYITNVFIATLDTFNALLLYKSMN